MNENAMTKNNQTAGSSCASALMQDNRMATMENTASEGLDDKAEIARLAALTRIEYDRQRKDAAQALGIRVETLDDAVKQARNGGETGQNGADPVQGNAVVVRDVEPLSDPVDGAELFNDISTAIREHIHLSPAQADTVALWSIYTHGYDIFRVAPRLGIRAPSMACGKSELMRRLGLLIARPLACENLTAPVLFRLIDTFHPTLQVDELDNLLTEDKGPLLGILNSGYSRDGRALRCVGDNNEVRAFSTFGPMVYAMIGTPVGTFDSRTIPIDLRRATPSEARALKSLESGESEERRFLEMGCKAARWMRDFRTELETYKPDMDSLVNRKADNWRPLFAIADMVGGHWPERAREAAKALSDTLASPSVFDETLAAIKDMFGERTEITSQEIVDRLVQIEGGPWAEWGKERKPITPNALARLFKPHRVYPVDIGPERSRRKGYKRSQFEQLFDAYLKVSPPPPPGNRAAAQDAMESGQAGHSRPHSPDSNCADGYSEKSNNAGLLRGCADTPGECSDDLDIPDFLRRGV
jgi:putative DNA primase/helicase